MHTSYNRQRLRLNSVYITTCNYIVIACCSIMFRIMANNQPKFKDIHCVQPQIFVVISCSDYKYRTRGSTR